MSLPKELDIHRKKIEKVAKEYGLDFFPTVFEVVSHDQINQIAAYGGFPVRYPHWRFGMEYEQLSKSYEYGLSKIYEMVINTDPCYAYLMHGNSLMDQKLVMAHVFGHADFFKNNVWFSKTNRKMLDAMGNHAARIKRYIDRYGQEDVESFIDSCLSLENLIDRYAIDPDKKDTDLPLEKKDFRLHTSRPYMEKYINPPEFIKEMEQKEAEKNSQLIKHPKKPQKDILKFLIENANLPDWKKDILSIIRNEAYYFSPQGLTKICNEGWASYWHSKIMTNHILSDSEIIEFADKHSGVMNMPTGSFNPYKIGIELLRDIENRWNKGQFGREWDQCDDVKEKQNWDKRLNLGREKIFEIRKVCNDVSLIDQYLTEDFCVRNKFFVYNFNKQSGKFEIDTRNFNQIKKVLLFKLTNFGQPLISVENANFENKGEMLLSHLHEGMDLQPDFMKETMENVYKVWGRPILLQTIAKEKEVIFRFDGEKLSYFGS